MLAIIFSKRKIFDVISIISVRLTTKFDQLAYKANALNNV